METVKDEYTDVSLNKKKGEELIQRLEIEGTPFTVISIDGKHFGTMGRHRITEESTDKAGLINDLEKFNWNRLVQVIWIMLETKELEKTQLTNKTETE